MTTVAIPGLYRYRLGDVIEVVGFYNATPKLNFICRRNLILTVNIDKNTERDLQIVLSPTRQEHDREVSVLDRLHGVTDGTLIILPEESSEELERHLDVLRRRQRGDQVEGLEHEPDPRRPQPGSIPRTSRRRTNSSSRKRSRRSST